MIFYLVKALRVKKLYGDMYDIYPESAEDLEEYVLTDEEEKLIDKNFIDETDDLCDALLDVGDYQFYNILQCKLLNKWLKEKLEVITDEKLIKLYKILLDYTNRAIEYNTGIAID